ncbi:hypothetical protein E2P81_ATG03680 [Venturia nashicola]|uniref:Uncharacterized protein n=1 Tax=Venturia nashicola TaxID=86259 RepID=A0A4Z1PJE6_9PEZI|nr:hypothetical protein E6O75_ATG03754 [Venturia nashicola]TLD38005.1 hypothetical protein E2P81_ATG03680 [Venturia nashicola]
MTVTKEMKMTINLPYHKFINQPDNHTDNPAFCESPSGQSSKQRKSFFSPLLNYFRAPLEESYHLDDAELDEIREVMTTKEKRKGRVFVQTNAVGAGGLRLEGSNGLVVEGAGTGDWRRPSLWG